MNTDFLKKDYQIKLPKTSWQEWLRIGAMIFISNAFMLIVTHYTGTSRPIINVDYFIALFLLLFKNKFLRGLGIVAFILAMLFDILMFVVQIFPFLDFGAIRYLLPFLSVAPTQYIIFLVLGMLAIMLLAFVLLRISLKQNKKFYPIVAMLFLCFISYQTLEFKYARFKTGILGRDNYYIGHSQVSLYHAMTKSSFASMMSEVPKLSPYPQDKHTAYSNLKQPPSNKILYIVAESWGVARTEKAQRTMLQKLYDQQSNMQWINGGYFDFNGSTVQGELRELCQLAVSNGYAFSKLSEKDFAGCLPARLKKDGYETFSLHGTSGRLYDRYDWYPKAGFKHMTFGENLMNLKRCTSFNGVCDSELINVVADTFKQYKDDRIFYYWLTLTSHAPYPKKDIEQNHRFNCAEFGMKLDGDICRNAILETQFFDHLATLMAKPEMKGVEVIIVGDHMPPLFGGEEIIPFLRWQDVSWLHFKMKE